MKFKLETISLSLLNGSLSQPIGRTVTSGMKDLEASIKKTGIVVPPLVTVDGKRYTIQDGHRRCAAATSLGYTELECLVAYGADANTKHDLFFLYNTFTAPVTSAQLTQSATSGDEASARRRMRAMNPRKSKPIAALVDILGFDFVSRYSQEGVRLGLIAKNIKSVTNWCVAYGEPEISAQQTAQWCIDYKSARHIDMIRRNGTETQVLSLLGAIRRSRPLPRPKGL